MLITELPFGLGGRVYRSPMPFSRSYDPGGDAYEEMKQAGVEVIVVLAEADECMRKSGRDLLDLYRSEGWEVIHLPVPDYTAPTLSELEGLARQITDRARKGRNVAVHCAGGVGRTGAVMAVVAKYALESPPEDPIAWVREFICGAVETREQTEAVRQAFS